MWFERNFWLFHAEKHSSVLDKLYYDNNKYFAKKAGFKLQTVSFASAKEQLSAEGYRKLEEVKKALSEGAQKGALSAATAEDIVRKLALLTVLSEQGGVMLSEYYCLTETFDWLRNINAEVHARRGLNRAQPSAFGFYDHARSSPVQKENIPVEFETERYIRAFPGLQPYFLVAKKGSAFIKELLKEIISILLNPDTTAAYSKEIILYGA